MTVITLLHNTKLSILSLVFLLMGTGVFAQGWGTALNIESNSSGGIVSQKLFEVNGRPAMAYYDFDNYRLVYKRANNNTGSSWPSTNVVVDNDWRSGNNSIDMEIVNGHPAIVSDSPVGKDVRYTRASDVNGSSWNTTVIAANNIATSFGGDIQADLEVVGGFPAIAYYDGDNKDIYYVRANDADGTSWGTPVLVTSTGDVGEYLSMKVISGRPSIAFYKSDTGDLQFVRANDATGTTWGSPTTIVSVNDVGRYCKLEDVNGSPGITYYDATLSKVMFTRSTTSTGSLWWDGEYTVANTVARDLNLLMVEGKPAVAYREVSGGDRPKYLQSTSNYGWTWNMSKTVDIVEGGSNIGQELSMAMIDGYPSVTYRDIANTNFMFARSLNTDGLPVEMTYFTGRAEERTNVLEWQTASEENNEGFEVQRSTNGQDWEKIGFVAGEGQSTSLTDYRFTDEQPVGAIQYYRLKQMDYDGQFAYSDIITIERELGEFPVELIQNPVRSQIRLNIHEDNDIQVHLMNISGQTIKQVSYQQQGTESINIEFLPTGTYLLNIQTQSRSKTIKIVKQ